MAAKDFKWYVYELFDPENGSVFYVGKGTKNRIDAHEIEAANGVDNHKCRKIRSIISRCGKIGKRKVAMFNDEKYAYIHEANRIAEYGLNNLTNAVLYTTLVYNNKLVKTKSKPGVAALMVIRKFADRFASWMRLTDGGKHEIAFNGPKTYSSELTEMFYNKFCKSVMMKVLESEETRETFIKIMRKYKLEVKYVKA